MKYPKLFGNFVSKSLVLLPKSINENGPPPAGEMHVRTNVCRKEAVQEETGSGYS
jgi:hypothetical protein